MGRRTLIVPPGGLPWTGNPSQLVLDIEAKTGTRLRDGEDPNWFIRFHADCMATRDPAAGISFAERCARQYPQRVELVRWSAAAAVKDNNGRPHAAPSAHPTPYVPIPADMTILCTLAKARVTRFQDQIIEFSGVSEKVVKERLPILEAQELIDRPNGPKRGYVIRVEGRALIDSESASPSAPPNPPPNPHVGF